jgi:glycyl-tRNA synthetase beta subunit
MSAHDFLFELGTEELPPLALPELERALMEGIRARRVPFL